MNQLHIFQHSYTLEFHFDKNDYFSNAVLTKQYLLKSTVDPEDPFAFEGPEIYKCKVICFLTCKTLTLQTSIIKKMIKIIISSKKAPRTNSFQFNHLTRDALLIGKRK